MIRVHVTAPGGERTSVDAAEGESLMAAIRDHGLPMPAICGGCCSCASCHVYIDARWHDRLAALSDDEATLVTASDHHREGASRLACQIPLSQPLDGMEIVIAPAD